MSEVTVTIGLCVKNCARTIHDTLLSLLIQDYPRDHIEVIVVDGKSTDSTVATVKKYLSGANLLVSYFCDEGRGLGRARQIVVENAKGKYIVWVDGDIALPSKYLTDQVGFMDRNPLAGAARGMEAVNMNSNSRIDALECMSKLHYYSTSRKKMLSTFAAIFRTHVIRDVGGFDESIKGAGEDIELSLRMRSAGWLLLTNDSKFYPRHRETWPLLWRQYRWYGYGTHYVIHKNGRFEDFWGKMPSIGFFSGLRDLPGAWKLSGAKIAFMLPFYRQIRDIAWWIGYVEAHFDRYVPKLPANG